MCAVRRSPGGRGSNRQRLVLGGLTPCTVRVLGLVATHLLRRSRAPVTSLRSYVIKRSVPQKPGSLPPTRESFAFSELLALDHVTEVCTLRSPAIGFMAYHGGQLEKVTDVIAQAAAEASGASYYAVLQSDEDAVVHLPSKRVVPAESAQLAAFLNHVDTVVTVHGYGRKRLWHALLLGGRNRELATHVAQHLRRRLPDYDIIDDQSQVPRELAGMHQSNPVNVPRNAGVQIELPATVRWNRAGRHWSDLGSHGRAPQVQALIDALAEAARSWQRTTGPAVS